MEFLKKRIDIITIFPEAMKSLLNFGVIQQGQKNNVLELFYHNPRDFTSDKHRTIDDRPYGGGEGMVMMCEPLQKTWQNIPKKDHHRFVYLSPQGKKLDSKKAKELAQYEQLIFLCGRYEGVDERFISLFVDEEVSIGDYVVSGGELPCAIVIDCVSRFYEGLLGNKASSQRDTFEDDLLKYPQWTRPPEFEGLKVPEILMSGNHKLIEDFRRKISILRTHFKRPELFFVKCQKNPQLMKELEKALELYQELTGEEKKSMGLPE